MVAKIEEFLQQHDEKMCALMAELNESGNPSFGALEDTAAVVVDISAFKHLL